MRRWKVWYVVGGGMYCTTLTARSKAAARKQLEQFWPTATVDSITEVV